MGKIIFKSSVNKTILKNRIERIIEQIEGLNPDEIFDEINTIHGTNDIFGKEIFIYEKFLSDILVDFDVDLINIKLHVDAFINVNVRGVEVTVTRYRLYHEAGTEEVFNFKFN